MEKLDAAVRQEIVRIADGWVADDDPGRAAAMIMIAGLFVGPNVDAIAKTMGIDSEVVRCIGDRLRASGLWTEAGGADYADWLAGDYLGVANFGLDLDVALGTFVRTGAKENGHYGYTLVEKGSDADFEEEWDEAVFPNPESSVD